MTLWQNWQESKHGFILTIQKENKSYQRVFEGDSRPKKLKQVRSLGKKTTPWMVHHLSICLPRVLEKVRERKPRSRILLHHHTANKTKSFLASERMELVLNLTHLAHSSDLVTLWFFSFPKNQRYDERYDIRGQKSLLFGEANISQKLLGKFPHNVFKWILGMAVQLVEAC